MSNGISPLEQEQTQRLIELGAQLREIREENLLSLEQVSAKTMIQPRLLNAIEQGHFSKLPEPVYIQGFIRRYADAVGADGEAFAKAFPIKLEPEAVQPSWKSTPAAQLRPMHLYAAYVFLIMGAIGGLSYLLTRSTPSTPTPSVSVSPAPQTVVSSPNASPATSNATGAIASSPSPSPISDKPVRVQMTLTAESWVRVTVDGKKELEEVLKEGSERTWSGNSQISIRAGNPGAVMLSYNENQAQLMGKPGIPETVVFPPAENQAANPPSNATGSTP